MRHLPIHKFDLKEIYDLMVEIPNGTIRLRDDRVKHSWTVEIQSFLLSKYLVTQELYFEITKQTPSSFKGNNLPVESVSWRDSIIFCNSLSSMAGLKNCYKLGNDNKETKFDLKANGFRLPTEAEWEYACKSGTNGVRYGMINEIAWYKENSGGKTNEVGTMNPNGWGLYDMLGNVWEWCSDIYDPEVYGSYRIFRGGGWNDEERACLTTNRRRSHPISFKIDDLGFRIAKNIK
jgi:formylglycine-generating enzyme required for sulfatase activity